MASSPAVLKQQAAALELRKQPEKALALYQQLLAEHGSSDDVDVALRNRVGDLHLRVGQMDEAIALFERSADEYALSGFLNNAIALCNKILRQRPGHVTTLRRLARFSAEKGMVVDAQRYYLSVAEALEKLGQHGEALKALSEFAELSPEDVHVRAVVVEQLLRAGRKPDAVPHLTVLHRLHVAAGRTDDAAGVAQVAREIDAEWVPESDTARGSKRGGASLILIDSDDDFGMLETSPMPGSDAPERLTGRLEGLELTAQAPIALDDLPSGVSLEGFEATTLGTLDDHDAAALADEPDAGVAAETVVTPAANEFDFIDIEEPEPAASGDVATGGTLDPVADDSTLLQFNALEIDGADSGNVLPADGSDTLDDDPFALDAGGDVARLSGEPMLDLLDADALHVDGDVPMSDGAGGLPDQHQSADEFALPGIDVDDESSAAGHATGDEVLSTTDAATSRPNAPLTEPTVVTPAASELPHRVHRPTPSYVNLADILRDEEPASTRMTIGEPKQTGDEEADFQNILAEFREGIEKSIPADDVESHFDLGVAFREMGLLDDAIAEFQIAGRSRLKRLESIEALGGCFLDKGEPAIARTLLERALDEPAGAYGDDTLRGVLYLMGRASELLGARDDGLRYYQRVYAVDIRFRDVAARIQTLQQPA